MTTLLNIFNKKTSSDKQQKLQLLKQTVQSNKDGVLYIMLSTLNQMVNYIPLKYFGFEHILNITTDDMKNKDWDSYFNNVHNIEKENHLKLNHSELLNTNEVSTKMITELKKRNNINTFFWNITGGQRAVIIAIYDLVKSEVLKNKIHYICYLEGNSGNMRIMKFEKGELDKNNTGTYTYAVEGLTIKTAFQLMGYNIKGIKSSNLNNPKKYMELWELYKKDSNLRKAFINSNKSGGQINDVKKVLTDTSFHFILDKRNNQQYPFGYILEDLVVAVLTQLAKDFPSK